MRDEPFAQHSLRELADFPGASRQFHAAGLAASAGMDLGLHDPEIPAEFTGRGDGRFGCVRRQAVRHRYAVIREQSLRLILVQVHGGYCQ